MTTKEQRARVAATIKKVQDCGGDIDAAELQHHEFEELASTYDAQVERIEELEKEVVDAHCGYCWEQDEGDTASGTPGAPPQGPYLFDDPCSTCRAVFERMKDGGKP